MNFRAICAAASVLLLAGILGLTGCENPSNSDTSTDPATPAAPAVDGTVTVQLSGATDLDGDELSAFLYAAGEYSIYTASTLLACNTVDVAPDGTATIVLKEDNGDFGPTGTNWVGTGGTSYDVYIGTDRNADGDYQPATTATLGVEAYRPADYPMSVTVNGDKTIALTFGDLGEYTGGQLIVDVTNGQIADSGKDMFFGVFLHGADPATDDRVGDGGDILSAGGEGTDAADQPVEVGGGTWYGTDGTQYDLYVFIDEDASGTDGPTSGDLMYTETYTQSGNHTVTLDRSTDFTTVP